MTISKIDPYYVCSCTCHPTYEVEISKNGMTGHLKKRSLLCPRDDV